MNEREREERERERERERETVRERNGWMRELYTYKGRERGSEI
jgi:hypothetical protein